MNGPDRPGLPGEEIIERIKKALAIDGTHTWEDVREMLVIGAAQIFWNEHGCWITQMAVFPRKRVLNVWIVAGELPEVMELQKQVERYALTMSCDAITVTSARFGWKHIAKEHGWEEHGMMLYKPVTGEMNRE
jgi:hypothetical protein